MPQQTDNRQQEPIAASGQEAARTRQPEWTGRFQEGCHTKSFYNGDIPRLLICSEDWIQTGLQADQYSEELDDQWKIRGFINLIRDKKKLRTFQVRWTSEEPDTFYLDDKPYQVKQPTGETDFAESSAIGTLILTPEREPEGVARWLKVDRDERLAEAKMILRSVGAARRRTGAALQHVRDCQAPDGSVPSHSEDRQSPAQPSGVTALAGMAFLAHGGWDEESINHEPMLRCMEYVLSCQDDTGYFTVGPDSKGSLYHHAISTCFLSSALPHVPAELAGQTRNALSAAVALLIEAQAVPKDAAHRGGWRYTPQSRDSDLSCTAWAIRALHAARDAGLDVPLEVLESATDYVAGLQHFDGSFGYASAAGPAAHISLARAGMGLFCHQLANRGNTDPSRRATACIRKHYRKPQVQFPYYAILWCSAAVHLHAGNPNDPYLKWMRMFLAEQQDDGRWQTDHGDILGTVFGLLALAPPESARVAIRGQTGGRRD